MKVWIWSRHTKAGWCSKVCVSEEISDLQASRQTKTQAQSTGGSTHEADTNTRKPKKKNPKTQDSQNRWTDKQLGTKGWNKQWLKWWGKLGTSVLGQHRWLLMRNSNCNWRQDKKFRDIQWLDAERQVLLLYFSNLHLSPNTTQYDSTKWCKRGPPPSQIPATTYKKQMWCEKENVSQVWSQVYYCCS